MRHPDDMERTIQRPPNPIVELTPAACGRLFELCSELQRQAAAWNQPNEPKGTRHIEAGGGVYRCWFMNNTRPTLSVSILQRGNHSSSGFTLSWHPQHQKALEDGNAIKSVEILSAGPVDLVGFLDDYHHLDHAALVELGFRQDHVTAAKVGKIADEVTDAVQANVDGVNEDGVAA